MSKHHNFRRSLVHFLWDLLAVVFILWGIFAAFTPLTPGSWLVLVGLVIIFGRKRTERAAIKVIGKKKFKKYHIHNLLKKLQIKH